MAYNQKNKSVTLGTFALILVYFVVRMIGIINNGMIAKDIYRLWWTTVIMTIVLTIASLILMHILDAIFQAIKSGGSEEPIIDSTEDERDQLFELKGTRIGYYAMSAGVFIGMVLMALGQINGIALFSILIFSSLLSEVVSNSAILYFYKRGY